MFQFAPMRQSRKPSLTPMIDVVFLLLVFFMLAARFGHDVAVPLSTAGAAMPYDGPPRLVDITASDLRLNGRTVSVTELAERLGSLMQKPSDPVILRPDSTATVQRLVDIIDGLRADGLSRVIVVEGQP